MHPKMIGHGSGETLQQIGSKMTEGLMNSTAKCLTILAFLTAQIGLTSMASAATLETSPPTGATSPLRTGAFLGARIRLAVGSRKKEPRLKAGLSFAAMQSGQSMRGGSLVRFGEGFEFGITDSDRQPHMSIAGQSLSPRRLGAEEGADGGKKKGLSTPAIVGIAIGGAALLAVAAFVAICSEDSGECGSD